MSNICLFKSEPGEAPQPLTADEAFKRDNIKAEAFMRQKAEVLRGKAPTRVECQAEAPATCWCCGRRSRGTAPPRSPSRNCVSEAGLTTWIRALRTKFCR